MKASHIILVVLVALAVASPATAGSFTCDMCEKLLPYVGDGECASKCKSLWSWLQGSCTEICDVLIKYLPASLPCTAAGYCSVLDAPAAAHSANVDVLSKYFGALAEGDLATACTYARDDAVYRMNAPEDLIPCGGTHLGCDAFFNATMPLFSSFALSDLAFPAVGNETVLVTFQETSTVAATGQSYSVQNTVLYLFKDDQISFVDIYYNSAEVAAAFCSNDKLECSDGSF